MKKNVFDVMYVDRECAVAIKNPLKGHLYNEQLEKSVLLSGITNKPYKGFNVYCINNILCTQKNCSSLCAYKIKTFDHNWDMSLSYRLGTKDVRICRG